MDLTIDPTKKTGIFGGTFDPIHLGHINIVKNIYKQNLIEQVIAVPAGRPPHKLNHRITSSRHRIRMMSLAFERIPYIHISNYETTRKCPSYTIQTARYFEGILGHNLFLIIGIDSLCELETWYQAEELVNEFKFIIYKRPGYSLPTKTKLSSIFGPVNAKKLHGSIVEGITKNMSSRGIRNLICDGKDVSRYLPKNVISYVNSKQLYTC